MNHHIIIITIIKHHFHEPSTMIADGFLLPRKCDHHPIEILASSMAPPVFSGQGLFGLSDAIDEPGLVVEQ